MGSGTLAQQQVFTVSLHEADCVFRYAKINIGDPPQEIEMDLNMLVSDFYVVTTTSRKGSKYDDFFSKSIRE